MFTFHSDCVYVVSHCEKFQEDKSSIKYSVRLFVSFEDISHDCTIVNANVIPFASFVFASVLL